MCKYWLPGTVIFYLGGTLIKLPLENDVTCFYSTLQLVYYYK